MCRCAFVRVLLYSCVCKKLLVLRQTPFVELFELFELFVRAWFLPISLCSVVTCTRCKRKYPLVHIWLPTFFAHQAEVPCVGSASLWVETSLHHIWSLPLRNRFGSPPRTKHTHRHPPIASSPVLCTKTKAPHSRPFYPVFIWPPYNFLPLPPRRHVGRCAEAREGLLQGDGPSDWRV